MSRTSKVHKIADPPIAATNPKLSAAQKAVLRAAAGHPDGYVPDELRESRGGSLLRTLAALVRQDLLQPVEGTAKGGDAEQARHRITAAGLRAIGRPDVIPGADRADAVTEDRAGDVSASSTKSDLVLSLLRQPSGASIGELMSAASWQAHSIRGFLSATVKKRLGHAVISEKDGDGNRRYRIPA